MALAYKSQTFPFVFLALSCLINALTRTLTCDNMKCIYPAMIVAFWSSKGLQMDVRKLYIKHALCLHLPISPPCCLGLPEHQTCLFASPYISPSDAAAS